MIRCLNICKCQLTWLKKAIFVDFCAFSFQSNPSNICALSWKSSKWVGIISEGFFFQGTSINDIWHFLTIFDPPTFPKIGRQKWTFPYVNMNSSSLHCTELLTFYVEQLYDFSIPSLLQDKLLEYCSHTVILVVQNDLIWVLLY